jgi:1-acyl-sn-glycerol-3-phosphate acyltransferase
MTSTEPEWQYQPAPDLDQSLKERLHKFPRQPDMLLYGLRSMASLFGRLWLRLYHRLEFHGRENLPEEGSFVLVANHGSHLDALCLMATLPVRKMHRTFPAAAADYFFTCMPRSLFSVVFINALPFERRFSPKQSLTICRTLLKQPGNVLIIFPEGTRSPDGTMGSFKPGIGLLTAGLSVPVVPCWLEGCSKAWPKKKIWPRPSRIQVHIGKSREFPDQKPGKLAALSIAAELEQAVRELGEQAECFQRLES